MLQNSLYYIVQNEQNEYTIRFNASHPIFAGHFPNHPIVPGACLVQMAEELVAATEDVPLHCTALRNLRFNRPITPEQEVTYIIKNMHQAFNVQILVSDVICAQFAIHYDQARDY